MYQAPYSASADRYGSMTYRRTGKSGLLLPAVSIGLWHNFGGVDALENGRSMIHRCFDLGITHFDLANNYGPPPGSAEENFGRIFQDDFRAYRDELVLSTKAGYRMWDGPYGEWGSRKYVLSSLDQSLKRMALDYVDIFYSHRWDPDTPLEETMSALTTAVHSGKAIYAGISNYDPDQTARAVAILRQSGTPCVIHQMKYSIFQRTPEQGLFDILGDAGVGGIAFSPLAQGLLSDRYNHGIPADSRANRPQGFLKPQDVSEQRLTQIRALAEIAQSRGQTLAQMALAWVLRDPRITSVLIGASKVEQIDQNVAALRNLAFHDEELARIDQISN